MRLKEIKATACAEGNSIVLSWTNPDPVAYPGIRVVRREKTHPVTPDHGVVVIHGTGLEENFTIDGEALHRLVDKNLKGETHYYYSLFPYSADPPVYDCDTHNRCISMATSPYDFAGRMYDQLPRIYHRYDTVDYEGAELVEKLREFGQLRRFLDLPGSFLDQFYSYAGAALSLHNLDRTDGRLLPLLAQWVAWQIDYRLEIDAQRNEIRNAPHLYKTVGLIPTVEATVKRLTNWESRTKEFVHNIFLSNNPEKLNIWELVRDEADQWQESTEPFSLNFAYDGRPCPVFEQDGSGWLFYHTLKKKRWDIWYKRYSTEKGWLPSRPLSGGAAIDKQPCAAVQADTLWVFWSSHEAGSWHIRYQMRSSDTWSAVQLFGDSGTERKSPSLTVDSSGGLWLFWLEKIGSSWRMKYNRHDGSSWQLSPPALFPLDGGQDPRVETDPSALFFSPGMVAKLIVFWARKEPGATPDQRRWTVACRIKDSIDPHVSSDWSPIHLKPKVLAESNESDPSPLVLEDGTLMVFTSSDHISGSWTIRQTAFNFDTMSWGIVEQISRSPFTERFPVPLMANGNPTLLYRSNRNLLYSSDVFKATETIDLRYSGSVSPVAGNIAKNSLHGKFNDFQTYTYDVGLVGKMTDSNWYSRETLGIYLTPDTEDPNLILKNQKLLRGVLSQFLPIQVRYVFVIEPAVYREKIYTYDFQLDEEKRLIREEFSDELTTVSPEVYSGLSDGYSDTIPEWRWLRSWSTETSDGRSVDFSTIPIDTQFRTWHVGVVAGGDE